MKTINFVIHGSWKLSALNSLVGLSLSSKFMQIWNPKNDYGCNEIFKLRSILNCSRRIYSVIETKNHAGGKHKKKLDLNSPSLFPLCTETYVFGWASVAMLHMYENIRIWMSLCCHVACVWKHTYLDELLLPCCMCLETYVFGWISVPMFYVYVNIRI